MVDSLPPTTSSEVEPPSPSLAIARDTTSEAVQPSSAAAVSTTSTIQYVTNTNPSFISKWNLGPATSIFTPPPSCLSTLTFSYDMTFGHFFDGYYDPSCYPSSTKDNSWDLYYYSPARCPLEWYQATTFKSAFIGGTGSTALSLGKDTTAVLCCPSGYTYLASGDYIFTSTGAGHICRSAFSTTTTVLTYMTYAISGQTIIPGAATKTTIVKRSGATPYYIDGDGVPVWWQSSDLAAFAPASSTSHTGSSATTTTSPPLSNDGSSSGLASGAKVGIGVGIGIFLLVIGLVAVYFLRRYRKRRALPILQTGPEIQSLKGKGELAIDGGVHEMYADQGVSELEGDRNGRFELSSIRNS